jgi:nitrite reductase/ring-hydroxylating ferredoxin subunit
VHAGGTRVAVGRTGKGYVAFQDRCTHRGGPLSDGVLMCGTVQCPWHGSQFDVHTGEVKAGPAEQKIETYGPTSGSAPISNGGRRRHG